MDAVLAFFRPDDKGVAVDPNIPVEDRLRESDDFFKKWSGPIIIGSFFPAIFAFIVVVFGTMTIGAATGQCGYPLSSFIEAAIAVGYMYLLVFSWVYLGDTISISLPMSPIKFTILQPFTSLSWVMIFYFVVFVTGFITFIVGSFMLSLSSFCAQTQPSVYKFTSFIVACWWIGFSVIIAYIVKLYFGADIASFVTENTREHTAEEMEERIFRKVFNEYDPDRQGFVSKDDFASIVQGLGCYVPDSELDTLKATLVDLQDPNVIKFGAMYAWFQKVTKDADEQEARDIAAGKIKKEDSDEED